MAIFKISASGEDVEVSRKGGIHKQLQKLVSAYVGQPLPLSPPASLAKE